MRGKWRPLPSRADKLGNPDLFAVAWLSLHRAPFLQRTKGRMVAMIIATIRPFVRWRNGALCRLSHATANRSGFPNLSARDGRGRHLPRMRSADDGRRVRG